MEQTNKTSTDSIVDLFIKFQDAIQAEEYAQHKELTRAELHPINCEDK